MTSSTGSIGKKANWTGRSCIAHLCPEGVVISVLRRQYHKSGERSNEKPTLLKSRLGSDQIGELVNQPNVDVEFTLDN